MSRIAEQSIIGALLLDINSITGIYDQLKPEMFQDKLYQHSYLEIVRLWDTGQQVNLVNLSQRLQDRHP